MPIRRRRPARRAPGRRRYVARRKNIRRARRVGRPRASLVVADRKLVMLKYSDVDTPVLTISAGLSYSFNTYKLNSAYDVNSAIGSTAMPGFNVWKLLYNRYRVFAATVRTEFTNLQTAVPFYCLVHMQPDATPGTFISWKTWRAMEGNKRTRIALMGTSQGQGNKRLSVHGYLPTVFGAGPQYRTDPAYAGFTGGSDAATNPARLLEAYVWIGTHDGVNVGAAVSVAVKTTVTLWVEFFDRIDLIA